MIRPVPNPQHSESDPLPPLFSGVELQTMRDQWKEFRRFRRKPVILASKLETDLGIFDCVALDLSLGGARLRLDENVRVLERVTLVLTKFGRFPSEIVWRNIKEAGLQFCEAPEQIAGRFGTVIPFE
jgi:hypothetical protein